MCDNQGKKEGCTKPYCKITNGECQFIKDGSETLCPMSSWRMNNKLDSNVNATVNSEKVEDTENVEQNIFKSTFNRMKNIFK